MHAFVVVYEKGLGVRHDDDYQRVVKHDVLERARTNANVPVSVVAKPDKLKSARDVAVHTKRGPTFMSPSYPTRHDAHNKVNAATS